jgi:voltage-gated potassium channel
MTVITVAAVGFQEVHPLSQGGKIFVIVLIFFNLGLFTYFIALLTRFFLDGEFIKQYKSVKMHDKIETLSGHVIICGFGRNGKEAAQVLHANHIPYVVVEEREEVDGAKDPEVKYRVKGNATRDEVLLEAGIKSARALISTLPVDADNVFTVLTAKQLNPNIRIISRASQDTSVNKLKVAGANNVIMPDKIGGAHMATLVMIPDVLEFIELLTTRSNEQFKVAELLAEKGSVIGELNLWSSTGCSILGVKNAREYLLNPPPNYYLNPGERLIVMGNEKGISEARRLV